MSRISELGDQVLGEQSRLQMDNPTHYNPGLSEQELAAHPMLRDVFRGTELAELYSWHNGVVPDNSIPMSHLWIIPGLFFLSANVMQQENEYYSAKVDGWQPEWYPLLSEGTADRLFVNSRKIIKSKVVPVFYAFWESQHPQGQIYDSIESMLETALRCYRQGIYYVDTEGLLNRHLAREAEAARSLNPHSDYWRRSDLT